MGKKQFCFFQTAETGNRTPDSGVKGNGANHYPRAPAHGIRGPTLLWIRNFLTTRTQKVVVDGSFSDTAHVGSGVPQGTVLGPILFLCYINDLPSSVSSDVRLFADDCLLYRPIKSKDEQKNYRKT